ncbi:hypothetical protein GMRT_13375 [Giardia muris]|uniref:Uncharacterized protein n=1 Tax=Giardia muris TaxID=5742 RepID=A0A4Z1SL41_GIAMU|nr:hypothetical protein GMRT_13375 [Giardia muris]|eukprot:TNJ26342.1 hypothetical protein GMRT_13375 [Giardia muris]
MTDAPDSEHCSIVSPETILSVGELRNGTLKSGLDSSMGIASHHEATLKDQVQDLPRLVGAFLSTLETDMRLPELIENILMELSANTALVSCTFGQDIFKRSLTLLEERVAEPGCDVSGLLEIINHFLLAHPTLAYELLTVSGNGDEKDGGVLYLEVLNMLIIGRAVELDADTHTIFLASEEVAFPILKAVQIYCDCMYNILSVQLGAPSPIPLVPFVSTGLSDLSHTLSTARVQNQFIALIESLIAVVLAAINVDDTTITYLSQRAPLVYQASAGEGKDTHIIEISLTLIFDTIDVMAGIRTGLSLSIPELALRISDADSEKLFCGLVEVLEQAVARIIVATATILNGGPMDALFMHNTTSILTSDLDEHTNAIVLSFSTVTRPALYTVRILGLILQMNWVGLSEFHLEHLRRFMRAIVILVLGFQREALSTRILASESIKDPMKAVMSCLIRSFTQSLDITVLRAIKGLVECENGMACGDLAEDITELLLVCGCEVLQFGLSNGESPLKLFLTIISNASLREVSEPLAIALLPRLLKLFTIPDSTLSEQDEISLSRVAKNISNRIRSSDGVQASLRNLASTSFSTFIRDTSNRPTVLLHLSGLYFDLLSRKTEALPHVQNVDRSLTLQMLGDASDADVILAHEVLSTVHEAFLALFYDRKGLDVFGPSLVVPVTMQVTQIRALRVATSAHLSDMCFGVLQKGCSLLADMAGTTEDLMQEALEMTLDCLFYALFTKLSEARRVSRHQKTPSCFSLVRRLLRLITPQPMLLQRLMLATDLQGLLYRADMACATAACELTEAYEAVSQLLATLRAKDLLSLQRQDGEHELHPIDQQIRTVRTQILSLSVLNNRTSLPASQLGVVIMHVYNTVNGRGSDPVLRLTGLRLCVDLLSCFVPRPLLSQDQISVSAMWDLVDAELVKEEVGDDDYIIPDAFLAEDRSYIIGTFSVLRESVLLNDFTLAQRALLLSHCIVCTIIAHDYPVKGLSEILLDRRVYEHLLSPNCDPAIGALGLQLAELCLYFPICIARASRKRGALLELHQVCQTFSYILNRCSALLEEREDKGRNPVFIAACLRFADRLMQVTNSIGLLGVMRDDISAFFQLLIKGTINDMALTQDFLLVETLYTYICLVLQEETFMATQDCATRATCRNLTLVSIVICKCLLMDMSSEPVEPIGLPDKLEQQYVIRIRKISSILKNLSTFMLKDEDFTTVLLHTLLRYLQELAPEESHSLPTKSLCRKLTIQTFSIVLDILLRQKGHQEVVQTLRGFLIDQWSGVAAFILYIIAIPTGNTELVEGQLKIFEGTAWKRLMQVFDEQVDPSACEKVRGVALQILLIVFSSMSQPHSTSSSCRPASSTSTQITLNSLEPERAHPIESCALVGSFAQIPMVLIDYMRLPNEDPALLVMAFDILTILVRGKQDTVVASLVQPETLKLLLDTVVMYQNRISGLVEKATVSAPPLSTLQLVPRVLCGVLACIKELLGASVAIERVRLDGQLYAVISDYIAIAVKVCMALEDRRPNDPSTCVPDDQDVFLTRLIDTVALGSIVLSDAAGRDSAFAQLIPEREDCASSQLIQAPYASSMYLSSYGMASSLAVSGASAAYAYLSEVLQVLVQRELEKAPGLDYLLGLSLHARHLGRQGHDADALATLQAECASLMAALNIAGGASF